jgi:hypothetical protein
MRTTSTQQVRQAIYHGSIERGQSYAVELNACSRRLKSTKALRTSPRHDEALLPARMLVGLENGRK